MKFQITNNKFQINSNDQNCHKDHEDSRKKYLVLLRLPRKEV